MSLYREGFGEAYAWVKQETDISALLDYIDALYGRDNIEDESDFDEVRNEALEQCRKEFMDTSSNEYSLVEFHVKLHQASHSRY